MVERRLTWLAAVVALWSVAIFWKLVSLQVLHHTEYAQLARARQEVTKTVLAPRGPIFDRTGQTLAMSVPTELVHINPLKVPSLEVASDMLSLALGMNRGDLYAKMLKAREDKRGYLIVKRKLTFEEGLRLHMLGQDWIAIKAQNQRHYPGEQMAAHVLGGVDFEETGTAGVEKVFDDDLQGADGQFRVLTDVRRRGIDSQVRSAAIPGAAVTLTIDERLQYVAEREIEAAVKAHNAATGSVVVMNPYTGEILAMASYPTFDPNRPPIDGDDPKARFNNATEVPFEPGSVFKVITISAALETTKITPETLINCHNGILPLFGRTIHDSHYGALGLGIIPVAMVLAHSSNVGAAQIGMMMGSEHLYEYVRRFGFGQKSGIMLPTETRGQLFPLAKWTSASTPSISMGQEISVTTLQLARAASVIANGGMLITPRLVLKVGNETPALPAPVRILKPDTAIAMRKMMEGVVLFGTGRKVAKLDGYSSAGKTGSAQIYDSKAKHYSHSYNGSFMGFAPVVNPAVVVVVTVNGTHGEAGFGGPTAGPVFRAVATEALRILDVPHDLPEATDSKTADPKTLIAKNDDAADLSDVSLAEGRPNILDEPEEEQPVDGPKAPNFHGMTMRAVLASAAAQGLTVVPDGSGLARVQTPAPGAALHQGERIRVVFRK